MNIPAKQWSTFLAMKRRWWLWRVVKWCVIVPEVWVGLTLLVGWSDLWFDLGFRWHYVTMTEIYRGSSPRGLALVQHLAVNGVLLFGLEMLRRKVQGRTSRAFLRLQEEWQGGKPTTGPGDLK